MDALGLVTEMMGNAVVKQALKDATEEVSRGIPLSKPLADSGVFPPMVYHMIEIGEETGNMEDMLDKVAAYYDDEVESATEALLAAMEPLIIIVMAVIVVPIVLCDHDADVQSVRQHRSLTAGRRRVVTCLP